MAIRPIRTGADPVLRLKARSIHQIDKTLLRLVDDMIHTMRAAGGIGLAAPQVGMAQRLFVAELDERLYVLINPRILHASDETDTRDEVCLSLPDYCGAVERPLRVTVRGKNRRGKEQTIDAEGLLARCFQHEIDHLDGILYTDRMKPGDRLRSLADAEEAEMAVGNRPATARKATVGLRADLEPLARR